MVEPTNISINDTFLHNYCWHYLQLMLKLLEDKLKEDLKLTKKSEHIGGSAEVVADGTYDVHFTMEGNIINSAGIQKILILGTSITSRSDIKTYCEIGKKFLCTFPLSTSHLLYFIRYIHATTHRMYRMLMKPIRYG